jgi:hypothetical protein
MPLSVIAPTMALNVHAVLGACTTVLPPSLTAFRVLRRSVLVAQSET